MIKRLIFTFILIFAFPLNSFSKSVPASFADLAEKLMPSVVNISTTGITRLIVKVGIPVSCSASFSVADN